MKFTSLQDIYLRKGITIPLYSGCTEDEIIKILNGEVKKPLNKSYLYYFGHYNINITYNFAKGIEYLKLGIAQGEHSCMYGLGGYYGFSKIDNKKAIKYLDMAIRHGSKDAYISRSMLFQYERNYDAALAYMEIAVKHKTHNAYYFLSELHRRMKNKKKQLEALLEGAKHNSSECFNGLGIFYKNEDNNEKAIEYYEKGIKVGNHYARSNLIDVYEKIDEKKAMFLCKQGCYNGDLRCFDSLGLLYKKKNRIEKAKSAFFVAAKAKYSHSINNYAKIIIKEGHVDKGVAMMMDNCKNGKISSMLSLGRYYFENGKYEKGIYWFKMGVEHGCGNCACELGENYDTKKNDIESAERYYELAIRWFKLEKYANLTKLFLRNDDLLKANAVASRSLLDKMVGSTMNIGNYYFKKEDYKTALKYYEMCLSVKGNSDVFFNIGLVYNELNDADAAISWFLKASNHKNIDSYFQLGSLYKKRNVTELAKKYLLLSVENGNRDGMCDLGIIYFEENDLVNGEKYYKMAIDNGLIGAAFNMALLKTQCNSSQMATSYFMLVLFANTKNKNIITNSAKYIYLYFLTGQLNIDELVKFISSHIQEINLTFHDVSPYFKQTQYVHRLVNALAEHIVLTINSPKLTYEIEEENLQFKSKITTDIKKHLAQII